MKQNLDVICVYMYQYYIDIDIIQARGDLVTAVFLKADHHPCVEAHPRNWIEYRGGCIKFFHHSKTLSLPIPIS